MTVPNHDWAKKIAEPTTETIHAELHGHVDVFVNPKAKRVFDGAKVMAQLSITQQAGLHTLVRRAIAAELEKIQHTYNTRAGGLIAPGNVAYDLADRANRILQWEPTWCVVATYVDGTEEKHPHQHLDEALMDVATEIHGIEKKLRMT